MMGNMQLRAWAALAVLGISLPAHAVLTIEITGTGERQMPVVIVPFEGEGTPRVVSGDFSFVATPNHVNDEGNGGDGENIAPDRTYLI